MKVSQLLLFGLSVLLCIFCSCSGIQVDHGPFMITESAKALKEKTNYLDSLDLIGYRGERPNVLIILVDDLSKYDLAVYGPDGISTPNIEKLAGDGILFEYAYTSSPVCSPSRAALFTGRYQQRFGFERQPMNRYARSRLEYFFVDHFMNVKPMRLLEKMADVPSSELEKQGIPGEEILLSEMFSHAGYRTGICGKWHLGNAASFRPNKRGFNYQYGFYEAFSLYSPLHSEGIVEHRHDYFANKHIWKQEREGSCAIRRNDTIIQEEEYLTFAIARETIGFIKNKGQEPFFLVASFNAPHTPFQVPLEYYNRFPEIKDHNKRVYYGMISALDDAIGRVLDALEKTGQDRNTLIIFASDNGGASYTGATENGPLQAGKFSQFEGGVNIPMILSYKEMFDGGIKYQGQVSLIDIFPTLAAAAGIPLPSCREIDGTDLLHVLASPGANAHKYLFWRTDYNKALKSQDWKLIWNTRDEQYFLYDLGKNNYEKENHSERYPEKVRELMEVYEEWERQMKDPLWPGVMEFHYVINGKDTWWAI